jgi:phage-related tail protein
MGYYSDLQIELQELNAHLNDYEPDFMEYAKEQMKTKQYAKEMDDAFGNPIQQLEEIITSLEANHDD